jgi:hypothetical protein
MVLQPRDPWQAIVDHAEYSGSIKVNLDAEDLRLTKTWRIALILEGEQLVGVALARRNSRSGAFDVLVSLREIFTIESPLGVAELLDALPAGYAERWQGAVSWNGQLPPATGNHVLAALKELRPQLKKVLNSLRSLLEQDGPSPSAARLNMREQRDAVALGLEMAGLDSREALGPDATGDVPFLRGLQNAMAREDAQLRHDAERFANWMKIDSRIVDVWKFEDPVWSGRRVTVLYADKGPLETLTGTDLIYYREETRAFVLVQYKRMTPTGGGLFYRPDAQLDLEIERFEKLGLQDSPATAVGEVRLSPAPFYLKLVEPDITRPEGNHLAKGMYFPLDLFQLLRGSSQTLGPNGGVRIGWSNAQRYITNGQFVALVQESWIGTRGNASDVLEQIIHNSLAGGSGLVIVSDETERAKVGGRRP